jgi:hypothetical protein
MKISVEEPPKKYEHTSDEKVKEKKFFVHFDKG